MDSGDAPLGLNSVLELQFTIQEPAGRVTFKYAADSDTDENSLYLQVGARARYPLSTSSRLFSKCLLMYMSPIVALRSSIIMSTGTSRYFLLPHP